MNRSKSSNLLDRGAIALSGLCLLHCLTLPFALLFGQWLGNWLLQTETEVHWLLLALAVPISAVALLRGYRRHHSQITVALGAAGLTLMFIGVSQIFGEDFEIAFTVTGVSAVLIAHLRNIFGQHEHA